MRRTRSILCLAVVAANAELATAQIRPAWAHSHDGAGANQQDLAGAVATNGVSVVTTGRSWNPTTGFPPPPPTSDIESVKYDVDGNFLWARRFDGPLAGDDVAYDVAIDASNGAYVAGQSSGYNGTSYVSQRTLLRYDAAGVLQWSRLAGNTAGPNFARAVAVAANGDAVVCGSDGAGNGDLLVQRWDASGNVVWSWSADGGSNGSDLLFHLVISAGGDVYAAGYVATAASGKDVAVVRLNGATGAFQWLATRDGGANLDDQAVRVAVDAAGGACIAGTAGTASQGTNAIVARFDAAGAHSWTRAFDGTAHGNDAARGIAADQFGRVVAGGTIVNGTGQDFAVWTFDALGATVWSATWNGTYGGDDAVRGMSVDALGNVTLAGYSAGVGGASDADLTFAAWDARGLLEWTHRDIGLGSGYQQAASFASSNGIYVAAGYADGAAGAPSDYRTTVVARTAFPYCFGDGMGAACPCGNASSPVEQAGCASSFGTGARLSAQGVSSLSSDTLVLRGVAMPNSSALYFQGTTQLGGGLGAAFGDGLRCAGGTVIRLGTKSNVGGASQYPAAGDPSVSVRGLVSPGTRTYQVWYRNAASFCTSSTFNLSNGLIVLWSA